MRTTGRTTRALPRGSSPPARRKPTGISAAELVRRLPNAVLVPGVVLMFGLLVANLAIPDPVPVLDEAAMMWGLFQGLRTLSERRKAARAAREQTGSEPAVVGDMMPDGTLVQASGG